MSLATGSKIAAAILLAGAMALPIASAELQLPRDGWTSWQVRAVEAAPAWCCYSGWKSGKVMRQTCQLDGDKGGFSISDDETSTDTVKVYARLKSGKVDSLQVYAASCPVEAQTAINDLGDVAADDSARWLITRVGENGDDAAVGRPIAEGALAALAMHRGELSGKALANFARGDTRAETRKWSVFWLSLVRGAEGAAVTSSVMFSDPEADVRRHAAFALSQSKSPRAAPDLIRLGNNDKDGEVRAQAWFWLAQTGAADAERAIIAALRKDGDDNVREQAIFALSQLPDERATSALIAAAEDQSLSREQRKRAVFWLSQSESSSAQAYLERVLARTTVN